MTHLLEAPPGSTVLVEHDHTGKCVEATAESSGVVRNEKGESFSAGAYTIVAEPDQ